MADRPGTPGHHLLLQFLDWVDDAPRDYAETMAAWRSHCPRLSIWEDALEDRLVMIDNDAAPALGGAAVRLTPRGAQLRRQPR